MTSKPGLNSPQGSLLRKTILQYNAFLRARGKKRIEEAILKGQSCPILGTPQVLPKVRVWHNRPEWMFQHRIRVLKTWCKLHYEQSLKLDKSIQEEWGRLKEEKSALEIRKLQHMVARAVEKQAEVFRTNDADD